MIRRIQVVDGDGEFTLDVGIVASDADALVAYLTALDVGDVYDDPMPALDRRSGQMPSPDATILVTDQDLPLIWTEPPPAGPHPGGIEQYQDEGR